jgi:hypothetical protein
MERRNPERIEPFASTDRSPNMPASGERARIKEPTPVDWDKVPAHRRNEIPEKTIVPSDEEIEIIKESGARSRTHIERSEVSQDLIAAFNDIEAAEEKLEEGMTDSEAWEYLHRIGIHRHKLNEKLYAYYRKETPEAADHREKIQDVLTYAEDIRGKIRDAFAPTGRTRPEDNLRVEAAYQQKIKEIRQWLTKEERDPAHRVQKADELRTELKKLEARAPSGHEALKAHQWKKDALYAIIEELDPSEPITERRPTGRKRPESLQIKELNRQIEGARQAVMKEYGKQPEDLAEKDVREAGLREQVLSLTRNAAAALMGKEPEPSQEPYQRWMDLVEERNTLQAEQDVDIAPTQPALSRPLPKKKTAA